jgi:hypothetical protein
MTNIIKVACTALSVQFEFSDLSRWRFYTRQLGVHGSEYAMSRESRHNNIDHLITNLGQGTLQKWWFLGQTLSFEYAALHVPQVLGRPLEPIRFSFRASGGRGDHPCDPPIL